MNDIRNTLTEVLVVAVPETAGSALYGMVDVLSAAGNLWQNLVCTEPQQKLFRVRVIAPSHEPFRCGNSIPVIPDISFADNPKADILILPELWLGPD